jgi:hypothetical protein
LNLVWAAFTVITIFVLGGGLYLWVVRRRAGTAATDDARGLTIAPGE